MRGLPRNSGKVNFVATKMPNITEHTRVTSEAKTCGTDQAIFNRWKFARRVGRSAVLLDRRVWLY